MAHFAELDENNKVIRVIVVHNNELLNSNGEEKESKGIGFCKVLYGHENFVQTSYNHSFRKQYASSGGSYDTENDIFISAQPYPSWELDENNDWQPPVEYPVLEEGDDSRYFWNEEDQSWDLITE